MVQILDYHADGVGRGWVTVGDQECFASKSDCGDGLGWCDLLSRNAAGYCRYVMRVVEGLTSVAIEEIQVARLRCQGNGIDDLAVTFELYQSRW